MKKMGYTIIPTLLLGLLTGCSLHNRGPEGPIDTPPQTEFDAPVPIAQLVLHKADYNLDDRATLKSFVAITNEADYRSELARHSVEVAKPINFATQQVVALIMGSQPAGGYAIGVSAAEEYNDKVVVTVELRSPGEGCVNTQAISNPYEFNAITSVQPIEFVETSIVQQCNEN